MNQTSTI